MKDWTGQTYDQTALADPDGGRSQYDANLIRQLNPRITLGISGTTGDERPAARCLTGFALSNDGACERCGADAHSACLSSEAGTAGATMRNPPKPIDPGVVLIRNMLRR